MDIDKIYITDVNAWCNISGLSNLMGQGASTKTLYINNEKATDVVIPDGITTIPEAAFRNFTNLTSVTMPSSVTSIENYAFFDCSGLTSVVIPNSVTYIGDCAFQFCSGITAVTIPNSVTCIGNSAFNGCSSLETVFNYATVPQTIDSSVFDDNYGTLYVPAANVTAYQSADYWKNFTIKPIVNVVASGTCGDNLTWTLDDEGLLTIEGTGDMYDYSSDSTAPWYSYRSKIKSLSIGNSVISIGSYAFTECSSLTSVVIPNSVTSIGNWAFAYSSGLTSVVIPNSVTSIGQYAFYFCRGFTSVEIGNSVTTIGNGAFIGCSSLTSVEIPNSVTSIGDLAFSGCSRLTSINVDADNEYYSSLEGVLFNKNKTTLIQYPEGKQGEYTIPNSVTNIGIDAFKYCSSLTSVVIPNSVTSIGDYALRNCSSLTSVVIGNSVTSIGSYAFYGCSNLEIIHNLAEVPQKISYNVFSGHYGTLYVPAGSVSAYQSADYWKKFNIIGVQNGDVNLDQKVNVTDAVEIVNNVVGEASERFEEAWSDVNSDNQYTIADAMAVVNIILDEEIGASYAMNHAPMADNDHLSLYSTDSSNITLAMDNMMQYSSFQFDVNLPEGVTLENVTLNQNRCKDFSVLFREMEESRWTVAVYNFGNEPFATGSGALLDMSISGSGNLNEASVSNIHFSTTRAVDVTFDSLFLSEATGIEIVKVNDNDDDNDNFIFDLSGRRLESMKKGVNIIGGRKVVIK